MTNPAQSTTTRVLIIDDDPLIRTLLVSTLRKECFVAVAAHGEEGFRKALSLTPHIAVIDVNMPGWDGLATLEAFRGHPRLRDVKIIMLTADSSKQTVLAAIRGGANDYLIKTTFSKSDFYKKLNRLVPGTIPESKTETPPSHSTAAPRDVQAGAETYDAQSRACETHAVEKSIAQRDLVTASNRQDAPASAVASGIHCVSTPDLITANSQLQVIIDGWE
jgi:CheY-like chemotaxis protein